jgi:hypothetical protein
MKEPRSGYQRQDADVVSVPEVPLKDGILEFYLAVC